MGGDKKFLIGIGIATLAIIVAGVFFFGRGDQKRENADPNFDTKSLVESARLTIGSKDAPVTIIEFGDIQCPACKQAQPIVEKILETNADKVYFIFYHYPLSIHKNSKIAAQAAEAAAAQEKFFEMIHIQYAKQAEWAERPNPREEFRKYATELGLNMDQFNKDMEDIQKPIEEDFALGNKAGVESTPTFFINGQKYPGVIQEDQLQQMINSQAGGTQQESTPEAPVGQ